METIKSRITAQGQISVPVEVRRKLGLAPGSIIEWQDNGDEVVVRRAGRYTSEDIHRHLFKESPKPVTLEDIKEGIRQHVRKRHARR